MTSGESQTGSRRREGVPDTSPGPRQFPWENREPSPACIAPHRSRQGGALPCTAWYGRAILYLSLTSPPGHRGSVVFVASPAALGSPESSQPLAAGPLLQGHPSLAGVLRLGADLPALEAAHPVAACRGHHDHSRGRVVTIGPSVVRRAWAHARVIPRLRRSVKRFGTNDLRQMARSM
jgi:hypothetical protein